MAKEKPERADLNNWMLPTYHQPETSEQLKQYAVCKHCDLVRGQHVGEELKCLFDATTFEARMSPVKK